MADDFIEPFHEKKKEKRKSPSATHNPSMPQITTGYGNTYFANAIQITRSGTLLQN
jgi:hypothetical protein